MSWHTSACTVCVPCRWARWWHRVLLRLVKWLLLNELILKWGLRHSTQALISWERSPDLLIILICLRCESNLWWLLPRLVRETSIKVRLSSKRVIKTCLFCSSVAIMSVVLFQTAPRFLLLLQDVQFSSQLPSLCFTLPQFRICFYKLLGHLLLLLCFFLLLTQQILNSVLQHSNLMITLAHLLYMFLFLLADLFSLLPRLHLHFFMTFVHHLNRGF